MTRCELYDYFWIAVATAETAPLDAIFCLEESKARKEYFYASVSDLFRNSIVSLLFFKVSIDSVSLDLSSLMTPIYASISHLAYRS